MSNVHRDELISGVRSLFDSSKYSDLTIHCGSDVYKVHRTIVCQRSDFFAAACDSGFKESTTATITLEDDDQSTVRRMLTYLYTLDYDDGDACPAVAVAAPQNTYNLSSDPTLEPDVMDDEKVSQSKSMNNIRVYVLAEKYNIPALKELAMSKFENYKPAANLSHFQEVINAVFDGTLETDSGLRDIVISTIAKASILNKMLEEGPLASAIRDHGSLGLGLLREINKKQTLKQLYLALESLYDDAMQIHIPDQYDSDDAFRHSRQDVLELQGKILKICRSVKLED